MFKTVLLGAIIPLLLVGASIGAFLAMRKVEPPKLPPIGDDLASQLETVPPADVRQVLALSDFSDTLDIQTTGTVVPFREIQIAAEVAGRIIEKDPNVRSGNLVKKGQVLLRIDPRDYELDVERLTQLKDQELAAQRELDQDVANAQRMLQITDQEMELADAEVKRLESLPKNIASQSDLDASRRGRLTAMNQRTTVQNQLQTLQTRRRRVELAEKLVETQLSQAKLNLSRTEVVAPVDGRIVSEQVEADSYVQKGSPLVIIEDTEKVEVAVNVRMDQLYWIFDQPGVSADAVINAAQTAMFQLPPTPVTIEYVLTGRESIHYKWQGVLSRIDGAGLDPQSRTVPVRVRVEDPSDVTINGQSGDQLRRNGPPALVRGMFVQASLHAKPATQLLLVPKLGVKPGNVIWKYTPDMSVLKVTSPKQSDASESEQATAPEESTAKGATPQQPTQPDAIADTTTEDGSLAAGGTPKLNPDEWDAGRLEVLKDVQVVGPFTATIKGKQGDTSEDFWICEVPSDQLTQGQYVVVSPLPGMRGDGTDGIRVPTEQLGKAAANSQPDQSGEPVELGEPTRAIQPVSTQ